MKYSIVVSIVATVATECDHSSGYCDTTSIDFACLKSQHIDMCA